MTITIFYADSIQNEGGNSFRYDKGFYNRNGYAYCDLRVIENRNKLSDGYAKGIITAYYTDCLTVGF